MSDLLQGFGIFLCDKVINRFGITFGSGWWLWQRTRAYRRELVARDGFLLVNLVWVVLTAYAALPLLFTVPDIRLSVAYFEAMSALTATGATAISGLDALPVSVNVWRCFLQLVGGLGIVLLTNKKNTPVVDPAEDANRFLGDTFPISNYRAVIEQIYLAMRDRNDAPAP